MSCFDGLEMSRALDMKFDEMTDDQFDRYLKVKRLCVARGDDLFHAKVTAVQVVMGRF